MFNVHLVSQCKSCQISCFYRSFSFCRSFRFERLVATVCFQVLNIFNPFYLDRRYFLRADSHFDISIDTSISIRKVRKICVNRGYKYISTSISTRNGTFSIFLCLCLCLCLCLDNPVHTCFSCFSYAYACAYAYVKIKTLIKPELFYNVTIYTQESATPVPKLFQKTGRQ